MNLKDFLENFAINPKNLKNIGNYYEKGKFTLGLNTYIKINRRMTPIITNTPYLEDTHGKRKA